MVWYKDPPPKFNIYGADFVYKDTVLFQNDIAKDLNLKDKKKANLLVFNNQIILRAWDNLKTHGDEYLFRPATNLEHKNSRVNWPIQNIKTITGIDGIERQEKTTLQYGFFETFGYRFTILFNIELKLGTALVLSRHQTIHSDVKSSLDKAEERRKILNKSKTANN